jgi:hypothetical protein
MSTGGKWLLDTAPVYDDNTGGSLELLLTLSLPSLFGVLLRDGLKE